MVELENENETTKLSSKINVLNTHVKSLMLSIDKLMEKLDKTVEKPLKKKRRRLTNFFRRSNWADLWACGTVSWNNI